MKKILLAAAAVFALGMVSAHAASPDIYQTAYSKNHGDAKTNAQLNASGVNSTASELKSLAFGADAGNTIDLTDVKGLKSEQIAGSDNEAQVGAQTNVTGSNLVGGGTLDASAQGTLGPLGAKVTVSADTKSIASATAVGAHTANDYTAVSARD